MQAAAGRGLIVGSPRAPRGLLAVWGGAFTIPRGGIPVGGRPDPGARISGSNPGANAGEANFRSVLCGRG